MKNAVQVLALLLLVGGTALAEPQAAPLTFRVEGAVESPGDWSVERLAKDLPASVKEIEVSRKEKAAKAKVVPLLALVEACKPKVDPKVKGHRLAFVVVVRGRDGYTAAFSLAELMPEVGKRDAWIALDRDGAALDAERAPVELLVPGDEKPARWVRGVASVTLVDTSAGLERKEVGK